MTRPSMTDKLRMAALRKTDTRVMCSGCETFVPLWFIEFDHHLALIDGGAHDEENVRALCMGPKCHPLKSAHEHRENCRAKRRRARHENPLTPAKAWPSRKMQSRPFQKRPEASR